MIAPLLALALLASPDAGTVAVDAGAPAGLDAGSLAVQPDAGAVEVDAGPPIAAAPAIEASPPPPLDFTSPSAMRVWAELRTRLALDTNFESRPDEPLAENVAELQSHARVGAEAEFGERARLQAEVRLWHRAVEQRSPPGETFLLLNGAHAKATYEAFAGESFLDLYTRYVDLRFGNQVLSFGANAAGAPADVLDPLDLREGFLFADPTDFKLPVLAARARGTLRGFDWTVAYAPFFEPDRYDLYGQDQALVQPGLNAQLPRMALLTRAQEDRAEQPLLETDRPRDLPQEGDLGLRLTRRLTDDVTVGADYVISREKIPRIDVDPELARFLAEGAGAPYSDPATSLSISQRLGAGEQLLHGSYPRFAVGEVEASALVGPVQVDADLGYSASRLYVTRDLQPTEQPTGTGVLTVSDARGTDLTLAGTATVLWIRDIPRGQELALLDAPGAGAQAHDAWDPFLAAVAGYRWLQGRLEGEVRGIFDARQRSYAAGGRATWNFDDHVHLSAGYVHFNGAQQSPLGYWRRNDDAWLELRLAL